MLLRNILYGGSPMEILQSVVFSLVAILIAMTFHEFAHAFAADKCGDPTAKMLGRMTLNPMKHLNPTGIVLLLLFGFGWANPVLITPQNFKNKRVGMVVTSAAGPLMNFIICFIALCIHVAFSILTFMNDGNGILSNLSMLFSYIAMYNMSLGMFNLIPMPPLDGSKIVAGFLPLKWQRKYLYLEKYSMITFFALVIILNRLDFLSPLMNMLFMAFYDIIFQLIGLFL